MTRQEQLKKIGESSLQNYTSKFIIPVPHKFFENKDCNIFDKIEKLKWKIINKEESKQFDAFNIKTYIYDNMIPKFTKNEKNSFLDDYKSLLLKKEINKNVTLDEYKFRLKDIDLWIFEEHISFFVLNIEIDYRKHTLDEISIFNNKFRSFKFLELKELDDKIMLSSTGYIENYSILTYLLEFTKIDKQSFLNITQDDCKNNNDHRNLFSIYNTSTNAKLLVAAQTKTTKFSNNTQIEEDEVKHITFTSVNTVNILSEIPFHLASCSSMNPSKSYTTNDGYLYSLVNNSGFNIWKYSSGIALHDSCAFIGLQDDGGPVVNNTENIFYFIYILNLYINFQMRYIETKIINKDFESTDINYLYKKLQKLKNQFVTDEIAIKFQDNEVHKSISKALKTNEMISEITNNLLETKNITQNNIGIYTTLLGFIFVSIFQEPMKEYFAQNSTLIVFVLLPILYLIFRYRTKIKKYFKL